MTEATKVRISNRGSYRVSIVAKYLSIRLIIIIIKSITLMMLVKISLIAIKDRIL